MSPAFVSWIARWLPGAQHRLRVLRLGALARRLRGVYDRHPGEFATVLHGFPARLNGGNPYPFLLVDAPLFNRALVELVRQTSAALGRRVLVIDAGASLGNTVLLLQQQAGAALAGIHCIEADADFLRLLRANVAQFSGVAVHEAMLARQPGAAAALVRNHPGTATAAGAAAVAATTLDRVLLAAAPRFDVLKIDIDGSDGEALAGAPRLLARDQPAVIFEWHPALLRGAGNDAHVHFATLRAAGYERLLWFRNDGPFSHFSGPGDPEIDRWFAYLIAMQPRGDPHFDIVALPPHLAHLADSLASLGTLPVPAP